MADVSSTSSTPSGLTGAGGGNMLRITGMATGLDIDGMVKKMMAAEQTKVDKIKKDRQTVAWKQEAYQDIIKDLKDFQSNFFDSTSTDKNILSGANFSPFDVTINSGAGVIATASMGAKSGTYTVDFTTGHLASTAQMIGTSIINDTSSTFNATNWISGNKIGFSIGGATDQVIILSTSGTTATEVMNEINNQIKSNSNLKGQVQAVVSSSGTIQFRALSDSSVKISSTSTTVGDLTGTNGIADKVINPSLSTKMSDLGLNASSTISINYNGTTKAITVNTTDKISDVINNISSQTGGAVKASFSQLTGNFVIETSSTGSSQSIKLNSDFAALGLTSGKITYNSAQDAVFKLTPPGTGATSVTVTKPTNNFIIDGVNYTLQKAENTTFTLNTNTQKVYDKIKGFIDKYNTIVDKIQSKINEKKNYDYKPLSDSQKNGMKDSEITAWNDKAKQGILKNDDNLKTLLQNLRTTFSTAVTNSGMSIGRYGSNTIGLDFSTDYNKPAHIDITDETKLKNAIAQNGDQILKMFTNVSSTTLSGGYDSSKDTYKEDGIFTRIKKTLESNVGYTNVYLNNSILTKYANYQDDFSAYGGSGTNTLPDQLYQKDNLIKNMMGALSTKQESYYQQFSKLESAMNRLNQQQAYLSQQFGG